MVRRPSGVGHGHEARAGAGRADRSAPACSRDCERPGKAFPADGKRTGRTQRPSGGTPYAPMNTMRSVGSYLRSLLARQPSSRDPRIVRRFSSRRRRAAGSVTGSAFRARGPSRCAAGPSRCGHTCRKRSSRRRRRPERPVEHGDGRHGEGVTSATTAAISSTATATTTATKSASITTAAPTTTSPRQVVTRLLGVERRDEAEHGQGPRWTRMRAGHGVSGLRPPGRQGAGCDELRAVSCPVVP